MKKLLFVLFITCAFLAKVKAQDKTVRVDTINIRGIVLDELGKPVSIVFISSKNKKLFYSNFALSTSTDNNGKFQLNGALIKDTLQIDFFNNKVIIINNGSRYLEFIYQR